MCVFRRTRVLHIICWRRRVDAWLLHYFPSIPRDGLENKDGDRCDSSFPFVQYHISHCLNNTRLPPNIIHLILVVPFVFPCQLPLVVILVPVGLDGVPRLPHLAGRVGKLGQVIDYLGIDEQEVVG